MHGYLSLDIICSSKLTVFLELRSRKTVRFSEQIMSADKYPCIFSRQMETIVYLTKREGRTGRISARGLDSTDRAQRVPYQKDRGPIFSQYGPEQAWLIRDLLHDWKLPLKRICILKIGTRKISRKQCVAKILKKKILSQLFTQEFCSDFYEKYRSYFPPS